MEGGEDTWKTNLKINRKEQILKRKARQTILLQKKEVTHNRKHLIETKKQMNSAQIQMRAITTQERLKLLSRVKKKNRSIKDSLTNEKTCLLPTKKTSDMKN